MILAQTVLAQTVLTQTVLAQTVLGQTETGQLRVGLTGEAHLFIAFVALAAIAFVIYLLRRRRLRSKYALLWLSVAVPLGVLAAFPGLLTAVSDAVGVFYPPALFLLLAVAFLFVVVVQFSWELSRLEDRTRTLAEEVALLKVERDLEHPPSERPR